MREVKEVRDENKRKKWAPMGVGRVTYLNLRKTVRTASAVSSPR